MIKIRSMVLVVVVLLSICLPTRAQPWAGSGTEGDPYLVYDANDLQAIGGDANYWEAHFKLINDIDLSSYDGQGGNPDFNIIAPDTNSANHQFDGTSFTGVFDGAGHVIRNFRYSDTGKDAIALFGCLGLPGEIKNLGVEDVNIDVGTSDFVAPLVGYNRSLIIRCYVTGSVVTGADSWFVGGLVGWNDNFIFNSYAACMITTDRQSRFIGGLVGRQESGLAINCYATQIVTAGDESIAVGGLVGTNTAGGRITNSYAAASVAVGNDSWSVGGLAGMNATSVVTNSYAAGSLTLGDGCTSVGGLLGSCDPDSLVNDSFWNVETGGPDNGFGTPLLTEQMKDPNTFLDAGWDFVGEEENGSLEFWRICLVGVEYPKLAWQYIAGDFVCPAGVDMVDLGYLAGHWLDDGCHAMNNHCGWADLEENIDAGGVNFVDFAIFAGNWLEGL